MNAFPRIKIIADQAPASIGAPEGCGYACPPTHEQIAIRAYELYWESGCQPGRSEQDWFQAQRDLLADGVTSQPEEAHWDSDDFAADSEQPSDREEQPPLRLPAYKHPRRFFESRQLMGVR